MTDDTLREARELVCRMPTACEVAGEHNPPCFAAHREAVERVAAALSARDEALSALDDRFKAACEIMNEVVEQRDSALKERDERDRTIAELEAECIYCGGDPHMAPIVRAFGPRPDIAARTIAERDRTIAELRAEVAELREDRERLDWLERQPTLAGNGYAPPCGPHAAGDEWVMFHNDDARDIYAPTLRAAIDAARAGGRDDAK